MGLFRKTGARHPNVPNLIVAQRVLDKMLAAAHAHIGDETGEAMVGVFSPPALGESAGTIVVLDTISPDSTALRLYHTFQQGDERQDEIIWWLQENWHTARERRGILARALGGRWDVPLRYLGDWHKQPGHMILPSGGDLMTALGWLDDRDNETDFLLAPIVTLGHPATVDPATNGANFLMMPDGAGEAVRVDFWYIDRVVRAFAAISPVVYADSELPALVSYPWHLVDDARYQAETAAMRADKLLVSITLWPADDEPPLDVCFLIGRAGADRLLIVVTGADHPKTPPRARVAPFVAMREGDDMYTVFASAWKASRPLDVAFAWSAERRLLDFIHAAEDAAGIARPAPKATGEAAVVTPAPERAPDAHTAATAEQAPAEQSASRMNEQSASRVNEQAPAEQAAPAPAEQSVSRVNEQSASRVNEQTARQEPNDR
jgi:hypothetical protein